MPKLRGIDQKIQSYKIWINQVLIKSLLNRDGPDLIPHARAMQASVALVILEPLVQAMFMELMAALSLNHFTGNWRVSPLHTMGTYSFEFILADRTCLTLRVADPTGYCVPLDDLEYLCVFFLHFIRFLRFFIGSITRLIWCFWYFFIKDINVVIAKSDKWFL